MVMANSVLNSFLVEDPVYTWNYVTSKNDGSCKCTSLLYITCSLRCLSLRHRTRGYLPSRPSPSSTFETIHII